MQQTIDFQIRMSTGSKNSATYQEHFYLTQNGAERKVFLYDYPQMYGVPYLYEVVVTKYLQYQSPQVIASFLCKQIVEAKGEMSDLVVLDLAAGSGLAGSELAKTGVKNITGVDIVKEAKEAVLREAPGVYDDYYVEDMTQLSPEIHQKLKAKQFNCLVCCSALHSFPPAVFNQAFNLIRPNGWIVFNSWKEVWDDPGPKGFVQQHPWIHHPDIFELRAKHTYLRRYKTDGSPVEGIAFVGIKKGEHGIN